MPKAPSQRGLSSAARLGEFQKQTAQAPKNLCGYGRGSKFRTHGTRFWRPLLYQLSYTPVSCSGLDLLHRLLIKWWAFGDSNPGPTGYEPVALTN